MADKVKDQVQTDEYALFNGDCISTMRSLPDESVDMSIYSPPFCGLYNYSSNPRDLSNCRDYAEFFDHYGFVIGEIARLTKPGRISGVHVMDVPGRGNGETAKMGCGANVGTGLIDFPGDVIRAHESELERVRRVWLDFFTKQNENDGRLIGVHCAECFEVVRYLM